MKKKLIALCLVICLAAVAVVGGTLAYFTDTEQATNTMVIGDVKINIEELSYIDTDNDGTKEWTKFDANNFVLYPIDNEQGMALYNKVVYTANTSTKYDTYSDKGDAYIRTIIAIEDFDWKDSGLGLTSDFTGVHWAYSNATNGKYHGSKVALTIEDVTIDGKLYDVIVFEECEGKAIPSGEYLTSIYSVWLDKDITQEQVAGWIDSSKVEGADGKIDIKVFSQGIQATGLTHEQAMTELGEINADNLSKWFDTDDAVINDIFTQYNPTEETTAAGE